MKGYAIDDDYQAVMLVCKYIERHPDLDLVGFETDPVVALEKIMSGEIKTDVLFLDIDMPGITGIEFAEKVKDFVFVVFVSVKREQAHIAYDQNVVDFVAKPFSFERFGQAVKRVRERQMLKALEKGSSSTKVALNNGGKGQLVYVEKEDIIYIMSASNYVNVYFTNREPLKFVYKLSDLEILLMGANFMRIHKSYIVNMNKIESIDGNTVKLANKGVAEVGKSRREEFMKRIGR